MDPGLLLVLSRPQVADDFHEGDSVLPLGSLRAVKVSPEVLDSDRRQVSA